MTVTVRRWAVVVVLLTPSAGVAFMPPGYRAVDRDLVIETDRDFPGYRFWLASEKGIEPLEVTPARPCHIDGHGRYGSHRDAFVIAAPVGVVERHVQTLGARGLWDEISGGRVPPGILRSELIDFGNALPFYDSRERVIDRYRLELEPGRLTLVWLSQNQGDPLVKAAWVATGVIAAAVLVGGVWWVWR
jgi:hypothetical protein